MEPNTQLFFGEQSGTRLREAITDHGAQRVLIITGAEQRFLSTIQTQLEGLTVETFSGAQVHVPADTVANASKMLTEFAPDTVITLGGGSATGLGKALRLDHSFQFIAIPTTYAGSEMTPIYGITSNQQKRTGRDDRVRPDLVLYDPLYTVDLPKKLTITSLINALAHPVGALAEGGLDEQQQVQAKKAIDQLFTAMEQLVAAPTRRYARLDALRGACGAGNILAVSPKLSRHHQLAHRLGGQLGLEHSALHALLLPQFISGIHRDDPDLYALIADAAGTDDLPAALFDLLSRAGAARSLVALGAKPEAVGAAWGDDERDAVIVRMALFGRRPSIRTRLEDWGLTEWVSVTGPALADAERVVIALHGRSSNADEITARMNTIVANAPGVTIVAPQAPLGESGTPEWYNGPYHAPLGELNAALGVSLQMVNAVVAKVCASVRAERVVLAGFSQGACLASESLARTGQPLGGLIAPAGARIGKEWDGATPTALSVSVLLGVAASDRWVRTDDVERTASFFKEAGAEVTIHHSEGSEHTVTDIQRVAARRIVFGEADLQSLHGFGNAHESESLPGALPLQQNSPHPHPHRLYAEQVNGTGFVGPRHLNLRTWLYRIRPSAQHSRFVPLAHETFVDDYADHHPDPNLVGLGPLDIRQADHDFIDGLVTLGGAGSPALRRGFAVHLYTANRSMSGRSFYNSDGDLLLIPQLGSISLLTELGMLKVVPGSIAIVPRGLKFSVLLHDGPCRGYVAEIFGRHFELPERGPIGANGMTDPRHFHAPAALHEDRLHLGYRITTKFCGRLLEAVQDHSPYDVVAWHGNYAPYVYDLLRFSPVSNVRMDHADPSIFTVLTAPLDEQGAHSLDFVFFPPRWEVTEHTFRPPYFHRNATTEINGIIQAPQSVFSPFCPGGCFVTPSMTAHGVRSPEVLRWMRERNDEPDGHRRHSDNSMWFQFETSLPISLSRWAQATKHRDNDWPDVWGSHRACFRPKS